MKSKPRKRYRKPGYPTRQEAISDPELLKRNQPPGWRSVPGMAGSVSLFLAANSAAQGAGKKTTAPEKAALVAPIFEHGEGRGAIGCVVVAPPVFLSEEEAWQVIDEELAKRGVRLPDSGAVLQGVRIPRRMLEWDAKGGSVEEEKPDPERPAETFSADRGNAKQRVALKFISEHNYYKVGGPSSASTLQSYDFRQTARTLAEDVAKQAKDAVYFGVLYDPMARTVDLSTLRSQPEKSWTKACRKMEQDAASESKRLLRLQVRDFIKWLQTQGAI